MPKVSVIMPVYNGERYLRQSIGSILAQSFSDFELIIVNDGSTDGTAMIISSFADPRIRTLVNENNSGIIIALNKGLEAATGVYLCRMDADDVSLPDRLMKQVGYMDAHPDIAVLGAGVIFIDPAGNTIRLMKFPESPEAVRRSMLVHNPFAHGSVCMRRAVVSEMGNYNLQFLHNEDYDLWLRLAAHGHRMANLPDPLVLRRIHPDAITVEKTAELARYRLKTLTHAIFSYFRKPSYLIFLVRPFFAHLYRKWS